MTYGFVRLLCAAYAAHAVAFIMEAWGADGLGDGTPPSQRPDRYEMLVVTLASRGENGIEKLGIDPQDDPRHGRQVRRPGRCQHGDGFFPARKWKGRRSSFCRNVRQRRKRRRGQSRS